MSVVERVGMVPTDKGDRPKEDVRVYKIRTVRDGVVEGEEEEEDE